MIALTPPWLQEVPVEWIVRRRGRELKTPVIIPHFRLFVRGCPALNAGVDLATGHIVRNGSSPAVIPPSLLHD